MRNSIAFLGFMSFAMVGAFAAPAGDVEALARAHQLQLEYRQGNLDAAAPLVKVLEPAVARSPNNPDLWAALGNAYMSQQGSMYVSQPDPAALLAVGERARDAFARAQALDKKNALLLASHGMAGMVVSQFKGDMPGMNAAVEEMNAAVRQAPNSTAVRLTRGFTIVHLPVGVRDTQAVTEDLKFVLDTSPGGRPEDVVHVLLGDVYAELGDREAAKREYQQVTGASAFAAEHARTRLVEIDKGAISPASIAAVRSGTGTRCVMCHAPGTDN